MTKLLTLTVENILRWLVALPPSIFEGLLLDGDGTRLLKSSSQTSSCVGVVALLGVLVCTLQDWVLLDGGHCLLLVHTTQPSVRVLLTAAEVNPALDLSFLPAPPRLLPITLTVVMVNKVSSNKATTSE